MADEGKAKAECEHCVLADMINAEHPEWDAKTILSACLALAGDVIRLAPGESRGMVLAQCVEALATRAGAVSVVNDLQPVSVVH